MGYKDGLDTGWLIAFLNVVEERSFTSAATKMGLAQSTVSNHVKRLESSLGYKLLERPTALAPLSLTTQGRSFLPTARSIVNLIDAAHKIAPSASGSEEKPVIEFSKDDVRRFATLSGDVNPLHTNSAFARRAPAGVPVVHGMYTVLELLDRLGSSVVGQDISASFRSPLLIGRSYEVTPAQGGMNVLDGGRLAVTVKLISSRRKSSPVVRSRPSGKDSEGVFNGKSEASLPELSVTRTVRRSEALRLSQSELAARSDVVGTYDLGDGLSEQAQDLWPRATSALGQTRIAALLLCSYLTGMELPGEEAMLCGVSVKWRSSISASTVLHYKATVASVDRRFGLVNVVVTVHGPEGPVADIELQSLLNPPVSEVTVASVLDHISIGSALSNKSAVVIGGGSGFGRAMALGLASQGAAVHVLMRGERSTPEERDMVRPLSLIEHVGDAASARSLSSMREQVLTSGAAPDILVCNAAPRIPTLGLTSGDLPAVSNHVSRSVAWVAAPLAVFLGCMAKPGILVIVSSSAVQSLPEEWPHYVAAKSAVEGLARWVAVRHPEISVLVVRPGAMKSGQLNTPSGREKAVAPEPTAIRVVEAVLAATVGGVNLGSAEELEVLPSIPAPRSGD